MIAREQSPITAGTAPRFCILGSEQVKRYKHINVVYDFRTNMAEVILSGRGWTMPANEAEPFAIGLVRGWRIIADELLAIPGSANIPINYPCEMCGGVRGLLRHVGHSVCELPD